MDYDDDGISFSEYTIEGEQIDILDNILDEYVAESCANSAMLIDMAGNIIAQQDNGACEHDLYSLAALASANFAAVDTMAKLVGESEFSLLFHKGESESIHFSKVNSEFLLITIFGKDVTLGLLRLKVADALTKINAIWE